MILALFFACSPHDTPPAGALQHRAYVVSEGSDELFVFDTVSLDEVGSLDLSQVPGPDANHMAMVTEDGAKVYVSASDANALVVVDAATLRVSKTIPAGTHVTHMAARTGTVELWVMAEGDNAVVVVDTVADVVTHRITSDLFNTPHFARFSGDYAYIPNITGNQIAVVDLTTYAVVDTLVPEGLEAGACEGDPCGFADAQITPDGMLFASHFGTGKVVVYNTLTHERLPDLQLGQQAWSAFVNPFVTGEDAAFVPSWADSRVSRVGTAGEVDAWGDGDSEVYGVNFSPTAPDEAFVLSRTRGAVQVLDRHTGALLDTLDVGGATETATTTPDGRLLLPLSTQNALIVVDTATHEELARYDAIGAWPWSVSTADGQNYCH